MLPISCTGSHGQMHMDESIKPPLTPLSAASVFVGICALDQYPDVPPDRQSEVGGVNYQL